ncbi:hypothetical protein [Absidia glauca]|uniref:J domain-containing protein n=1 Tax=Absidia glauca TaxID=4829 RepID=A0A168Q226_ABSGL|nr:hypothetical protein [Absidia glauca]
MQLPEGTSLYDILELNKDEVDKDNALIKKAYRKLALLYHPDKQPASSSSTYPTADTTHQFQLVGYAYSILSDTSKRRLYDSDGNLNGPDLDFFAAASLAPGGKTWTEYFMDLAEGVVNEETLEEHALKYKGSIEEEEEVLKQYTTHKGNMNHILSYVPHSKAADVPRFMIMVKKALEAKKITPFSAYARTTTKSAQLQRTKREVKEAKQLEQQKRDHGGETNVAATVEQQHDDRVSSAASVNTRPAQTSSEMATNLASIIKSSINQEQLPESSSSAINQEQPPESSSSATGSHDDAQAKGHEGQEDDTGATKPPSPRKDTKGKEPMASSKTSTKTTSHDDDTTKDQGPKRTITTRSMTRTRDQQKGKMAKSSRGSTTFTTTTTTTTTSTKERTVLATTEKKSTRTTTKAGKRGGPTETDNIGESSRPTKKKKSNSTGASSQQTRRLRPRDKGANKS